MEETGRFGEELYLVPLVALGPDTVVDIAVGVVPLAPLFGVPAGGGRLVGHALGGTVVLVPVGGLGTVAAKYTEKALNSSVKVQGESLKIHRKSVKVQGESLKIHRKSVKVQG